ncbi:MAG: hypothetical protein K1X94_28320 [Sandaracinaceae bacterium]|nr:hypothetical protein [Sandaracinaceae bacterium]
MRARVGHPPEFTSTACGGSSECVEVTLLVEEMRSFSGSLDREACAFLERVAALDGFVSAGLALRDGSPVATLGAIAASISPLWSALHRAMPDLEEVVIVGSEELEIIRAQAALDCVLRVRLDRARCTLSVARAALAAL